MIDQLLYTIGDFLSSLNPAIMFRYRVLVVLSGAAIALMLLLILFRIPSRLGRRDRSFLAALSDCMADRFGDEAGKAFSDSLKARDRVSEEDPRERIRGKWCSLAENINVRIYCGTGYWRADISGTDDPFAYSECTVLRYMDAETYDKNLYTAQGKRFWTIAYDELLDIIFIPELGTELRRKEWTDRLKETKEDIHVKLMEECDIDPVPANEPAEAYSQMPVTAIENSIEAPND